MSSEAESKVLFYILGGISTYILSVIKEKNKNHKDKVETFKRIKKEVEFTLSLMNNNKSSVDMVTPESALAHQYKVLSPIYLKMFELELKYVVRDDNQNLSFIFLTRIDFYNKVIELMMASGKNFDHNRGNLESARMLVEEYGNKLIQFLEKHIHEPIWWKKTGPLAWLIAIGAVLGAPSKSE